MMLNYRLLIETMYKFMIHILIDLLQLECIIQKIVSTNVRMSAIHKNVMDDSTPSSSHHPCVELLKTASHEPIMQSIVDCFDRTMIGCENAADSSHCRRYIQL